MASEGPEDKAAGLRKLARDGLGQYVDEEYLKALFDSTLVIEKKAWGSCPDCKKQVQVTVPDAKAVVAALADIVQKIADVPKEQVQEQDRIVFERVIYMAPEESQSE